MEDRAGTLMWTEHDGRPFLDAEMPHALDAYADPASVCERPRRARQYGHATIVLPSRSDQSRTALLTYGTVDQFPELMKSMCTSTLRLRLVAA